MQQAVLVGAVLVGLCWPAGASAVTYSSKAGFLAAHPGLNLVSFAGKTTGLVNIGNTSLGGLGLSGRNLHYVGTRFWGPVDSLLDNAFGGFIRVATPPATAIGFYFASGYNSGNHVDFTAYNGASIVYTAALTGGGVLDGFSYFGLDGVGSITAFTLNSAHYTNSFASIAEISFGNSFNGPPPLPEPGSWAMLIAGFGLAGAVARRRRMRAA